MALTKVHGRMITDASVTADDLSTVSADLQAILTKLAPVAGILSSATDTGAVETAYSGGTIPNPTVSGTSTGQLFALVASQNCRSRGPARAVNIGSIYSEAKGNVSGNYSARQCNAWTPQGVNIGSEECWVWGGFRGGNLASIYSGCENESNANVACRSSYATGRDSVNIACSGGYAGRGGNARLTAVVNGSGAVASVTVDRAGAHYLVGDALVFYDRIGSGTSAAATVATIDGSGGITGITVSNGGTGYTSGSTDCTVDNGTGDYSGNYSSTTTQTYGTSAVNVGSNQCVASGTGSGNYSSDDGTASGTQAANVATNDCTASGTINAANVASNDSTASGANSSANLASGFATSSGAQSANLASRRCTASGDISAVIASGVQTGGSASSDSVASGVRSALIAGTGNAASADMSVVIGCNIATASASNAIVLASRRVLNSTARSVAGGNSASGSAATANRTWHIKSDAGTIEASGTITGSTVFTDFAEMFPNAERGVIPLGTIVTLEGRHVRPARAGDRIAGVVSATAGIVLGDSPFAWAGRYLTGEFGELLYEDAADEDTGETVRRRVENPDYNPSLEHVRRSERPEEWSCIGLIGQVHVRVGGDVEQGSWIGADGDVWADESRLLCLSIKRAYDDGKGYGVALCLLR